MKTIDPAGLSRMLTQDPSLAVIDVRTPLEYEEVHVAQAMNLPLDSLNPRALVAEKIVPGDRPVYILCRSGQRAAKAADQFGQAGFDQTVVVEGGTLAWVEAGLPVTRSEVKVISLERQVRIAAGSLVVIGVLLSWLIHPGFIGLSAFVGAGLVFAGITDWCGMGLLLAKAPWNQRTTPAR